MSIAAARSRWRFVIAPRWLAWHAFTVVAVWGMLWLGDWQFHRAEGGNALSWAYTFEWPVFAAFGIVFWIKTMIDEAKPAPLADAGTGATAIAAEAGGGMAWLPGAARRQPPAEDEDEPDPELDEYNAYLAQLGKRVPGSNARRPGLR